MTPEFAYIPEEKLTPEKVVQILKEEGQNVSLDEAKDILIFFRELAKIAVDQYIRECAADKENAEKAKNPMAKDIEP